FMNVVSISGKADAKEIRLVLDSRSEGRKTKVAVASEIFYEDKILTPKISFWKSPDNRSGAIEMKFVPAKGRKYTFYKIVSAASSGSSDDKRRIQLVMDN